MKHGIQKKKTLAQTKYHAWQKIGIAKSDNLYISAEWWKSLAYLTIHWYAITNQEAENGDAY